MELKNKKTASSVLFYILLVVLAVGGLGASIYFPWKERKAKASASYVKPVGQTVKLFYIEGAVFDIDAYFVIGPREQAYKIIQDNYDSTVEIGDFDYRGLTFTIENGKPPLVWLPEIDTSTEGRSVAEHELTHLTHTILHWAGVPLCDSTDEVYAYMTQYYVREFYTHIQNKQYDEIHR